MNTLERGIFSFREPLQFSPHLCILVGRGNIPLNMNSRTHLQVYANLDVYIYIYVNIIVFQYIPLYYIGIDRCVEGEKLNFQNTTKFHSWIIWITSIFLFLQLCWREEGNSTSRTAGGGGGLISRTNRGVGELIPRTAGGERRTHFQNCWRGRGTNFQNYRHIPLFFIFSNTLSAGEVLELSTNIFPCLIIFSLPIFFCHEFVCTIIFPLYGNVKYTSLSP